MAKQIDAKEMAESLIGQRIVGLKIDYDAEIITLELDDYDLDFKGDGLGFIRYEVNREKAH